MGVTVNEPARERCKVEDDRALHQQDHNMLCLVLLERELTKLEREEFVIVHFPHAG